jgi:hypothetical protein
MFLKLPSFTHCMLRNMKSVIVNVLELIDYKKYGAVVKRIEGAYIYC